MKRYEEIAEELIKEINEGVYQQQELLPSENKLIERFKVSRMTVRQALDVLVGKNMVTKKPGKGTFVTGQKIKSFSRGLIGFSESAKMQNKESDTIILSNELVAPNDEVQELLNISASELVYRVERLRLISGEVYIYEIDFIPLEYTNELPEEKAKSLFKYLENEMSYTIAFANYKIEAIGADKTIAKHMQVNRQAPILFVQVTHYLNDSRPLYASYSYYRHEYYSFNSTIQRNV
ncbi:GntR family transcriptional regulator [Culicoidibacter larvae]|uniref:GntR family transcriptional regulator n=1 Tax=Culicoidibacter larvae TaxID=2579976 RepID=A0A5R8QJ97_9FIRM|nr:GntR family transcriptional regulator [Culicoidibacter larvae]TLG77327.1 GntR family transcriptional regulator [Culicoidibacter larvae]